MDKLNLIFTTAEDRIITTAKDRITWTNKSSGKKWPELNKKRQKILKGY